MKIKLKKRLMTIGLTLSFIIGSSSLAFADMENFIPKRIYTQNVFYDVSIFDWFYEDVKESYELELMSGKGYGLFDPKGDVTIAEAITLATTIHSIYYENEDIIDNKGINWYDGAVEYAKVHDIIKGDEFYSYIIPATREQLAYIFSRTLPISEFNKINNIENIPDVDISNKYETNIYVLYNAGILRGVNNDGRFNPDSNITRAETSALVNRLVNKENRLLYSISPVIEEEELEEVID